MVVSVNCCVMTWGRLNLSIARCSAGSNSADVPTELSKSWCSPLVHGGVAAWCADEPGGVMVVVKGVFPRKAVVRAKEVS